MNRSNRFSKLLGAMGMDKEVEKPRVSPGERVPVAPERNEALTGAEHPELQKKRQMQMLIDTKISQLEESDDPNALESLNYWKQKKQELGLE